MSGCQSCGERLVFRPDGSDDGEEETGDVPDDLLLPCGCHFHWGCLLESATDIAVSLKCPSCEKYLPSNEAGPSATNPIFHIHQDVSIMTRYHSEGGVEENYDILPTITAEAYEAAHPEAREAMALLTMCTEGDVVGMLELLRDHNDTPREESLNLPDLLRYQNPLDDMKSALHIAVEKNQQEAFFLLLFLASRLPTDAFPSSILQSARQVGLNRLDQHENVDIRTLKDAKGDTAEDYASRQGGDWALVMESGVFSL